MNAVTVEKLSKNYRIYSKPSARLKELIFRGRSYHQDFWALTDVSFQVGQGSSFGIIGENGSGKSTLLQIIAGTMTPTRGRVGLSGRVAALLELGAGFNSEFTGRENAFLNAAIMGLSREEIDQKMPEIERFAEIGSFIDQSVKTYSSGMYVRLAFAIAINLDPEVLLVDESLAVGDVYFQQRCIRKLRQMRAKGKTILLVSHDIAAVRNLCDSVIWLEQGRVKDLGAPDKVTSRYLAALMQRRDPYAVEEAREAPETPLDAAGETAVDLSVRTLPNVDERWGNGHARVLGIRLLDQAGREPQTLFHGDRVTVRVSVQFDRRVESPLIGILIRNRLGEDISGSNTSVENLQLPPAEPGQIYTVDFRLRLPVLQAGHYYLTPAVADGTHRDSVMCDFVENALNLTLKQRETVYGYLNMECRIELKQVSSAKSDLVEARYPVG
ncbi:MAG: ABC transporter ATP-binding protein [Acidobacteriota bacterium]|nr:ABC transporter ATP-binding protein [Acidobacteriota bacterium]MDE2965751.1 ABC transporter ATP-binding protein [Acidobacteriota bacterium]